MLKILTLLKDSNNYGGVLQSYALQHFVACKFLSSFQIFFSPSIKKVSLLQRAINLTTYKLIIKIITPYYKTSFAVRGKYFRDFIMRWIPHTSSLSSETLSLAVKSRDVIIAGSDQIWNPAWTEDAYFLNFVPDHNGKIAYAASIGTNSVSQTFLEHVVPLINRFDFISVREESAKEILQPYVDKPIKVVLDPTLLLRREEWDEIAVQPTIPEPYIFVYLLGEKREHRRLIKKYAKTLGLKIVFLPHVHFRFNPADCFFADYNLYDVGPREFVGLIKNAETVITDSFHGCVFSIIYQKKFWALKRHKDSEKENMNSRLYTLFDSLGLRDRLIEDESATYDAKSLNRQIDYSMVETKLEALRKDSSDFLLNAIESVRKRMENDKHSAK